MHKFTGKVFFHEVDKGGVVYFANYLKIFDNARTTYFNELGFGFSIQEKEQKVFAVANLSIAYKRSLYLDDDYEVITKIERMSNVSMDIEQEILRSGELVTSCQMKLACLDFANEHKLTKIPNLLKQKLVGP